MHEHSLAASTFTSCRWEQFLYLIIRRCNHESAMVLLMQPSQNLHVRIFGTTFCEYISRILAITYRSYSTRSDLSPHMYSICTEVEIILLVFSHKVRFGGSSPDRISNISTSVETTSLESDKFRESGGDESAGCSRWRCWTSASMQRTIMR